MSSLSEQARKQWQVRVCYSPGCQYVESAAGGSTAIIAYCPAHGIVLSVVWVQTVSPGPFQSASNDSIIKDKPVSEPPTSESAGAAPSVRSEKRPQ